MDMSHFNSGLPDPNTPEFWHCRVLANQPSIVARGDEIRILTDLAIERSDLEDPFAIAVESFAVAQEQIRSNSPQPVAMKATFVRLLAERAFPASVFDSTSATVSHLPIPIRKNIIEIDSFDNILQNPKPASDIFAEGA